MFANKKQLKRILLFILLSPLVVILLMRVLDTLFYLNGFKKVDRTPIVSKKFLSYKKGYTIQFNDVVIPNNGLYILTMKFEPKYQPVADEDRKTKEVIEKPEYKKYYVNYSFVAAKSKKKISEQHYFPIPYRGYYEQGRYYFSKRIYSEFLRKGNIRNIEVVLDEDIDAEATDLYDIYLEFSQTTPSK